MKQEGRAKNLTKRWKHRETLSTLAKQIHFSQTRNVVFTPTLSTSRRQLAKKTPRPSKWWLTLLTHSALYAHPHPSLRHRWENCESSFLPPLLTPFSPPAATHFECMKCDFSAALFSVQIICYFDSLRFPLPSSLTPSPSSSSSSLGRCDWLKAEGSWAEWG